ncbi:hypothetical protein [Dendronalium sp. ChiSLP03b]|uniref:hypothetical protein n=1 Tax=Dendronalium sp. ChiSLP03b TaxID=3075381 RepID=UPI00391DC098
MAINFHKFAPSNAKNALILAIIELFKCFRVNPNQAIEILEQVRNSLPAPSQEDIDDTANAAEKEVILTISLSPMSLIGVRSQATTTVKPVIQDSIKL